MKTIRNSELTTRNSSLTVRYSPLSENLWRAGPGFRDNLDLFSTQKSVELVMDEHINLLKFLTTFFSVAQLVYDPVHELRLYFWSRAFGWSNSSLIITSYRCMTLMLVEMISSPFVAKNRSRVHSLIFITSTNVNNVADEKDKLYRHSIGLLPPQVGVAATNVNERPSCPRLKRCPCLCSIYKGATVTAKIVRNHGPTISLPLMQLKYLQISNRCATFSLFHHGI